MKKRATDETLGELHVKLAEWYLEELKKGNMTPAMASTAVKFLKDNKIEGDLSEYKVSPEQVEASLPDFPDDELPMSLQ